MDPLAIWLIFVGFLRILSVILGYRGPTSFRDRIFGRAKDEGYFILFFNFVKNNFFYFIFFFFHLVTALQARTFSVWTLLSCTCCFVTATHLDSRPVFMVTLCSFWIAFLFFAIEYFKYRTVKFSGLLGPLIVSSNIILLFL